MKRKLLLLLTILSIGFATCSKEDKKPSDTPDIVGRWYATEVEVDKKWQLVKNSCFDGTYAEFSEELIYKSYDSCTGISFSGSYSRSGNIVTCKVGAATVIYRIIELSGNNSTLEMTEGSQKVKMKAVRSNSSM